MVGRPSTRRGRRREKSAIEQAQDAYEDAAKSLMSLVEASGAAAAAYSRLAGPAIGGDLRKAAAKMSTGCAWRKAAAEDLLRSCCLDGAGQIDVVPGVWRDDIAAGAEGMASLSNRAAAMCAANGALSSTSTASAVFAEVLASDGWMAFAARVAAAERAAAGTVLGARPAEGQAAAAARLVERSMPALRLEEEHAEGGGAAEVAAVGAMGAGENVGQAEEAGGRAAAMRREAANMWAEASALWSKAYDLAKGKDDMVMSMLALSHARMADENASRLRAA